MLEHLREPLALWDVWTPFAGAPLAFEPPSAGFAIDWALLRAWMREPVDIERYVADLGRPGALTAALNYYRANLPVEVLAGLATRPALPPVSCPVLGVWSDGDIGCGEAQMLASQRHVTGPWRYHRITGAGHWIPLDAPDELTSLLADFLGAT